MISTARRSALQAHSVERAVPTTAVSFLRAFAPRAPRSHAAAELRVVEQALERGPQRVGVSRRDEQAGLAVHDEVEQAADRGRDDRPPVRHRLGAGHAEALAPRRARDHGRARVQRRSSCVRDEAERPGHALAQRPVAGDDERHPVGRRDELEHALLRATAGPT